MSNIVRLSERPAAARVEDYLGPAEVVRVHAHEVHVARPDGAPVRAEMALAFPYQPVVGDTLLVIAKGDATYVIGVLRGSGRSELSLPGDVELRAAGELRLAGDKGVRIDGPEIDIAGQKLRMVADSVVQRFTSVFQRVAEVLSVHAGESHTLVEGAAHTQAKTAAIVTEGTVTINGDEIHLG